jgi:phenylacetate-CoA ligase
MNDLYDALEARDPAEREATLMTALPRQVAQAQAHSEAMALWLAEVKAGDVDSRAALARLPVLRKHELLARQQAGRARDPFGGFATIGWTGLRRATGARRVYQSPGTLYEPEGQGADYWRTARALWAAGLRGGDLAHCSFSYHLTPAGAMMETGAHTIGCTTFAGGVGHTELQLQAMAELHPQAYMGTPSFLKILVDKAQEAGLDIGSLRKALVSGEACPPSLVAWLQAHGINTYQAYATADVGLIAYETSARQGLVLDEGVILEIVRPGTGDPVPDGEVGEVVITTLNPDYPLLRFGTGDLSAVLPGACPTGRTNTRIKGWLGRADQTTKVRGMFVHPGQVAEVLRRHPDALRGRLVVAGEMAQDRMTLHVEVARAVEGLHDALADSVRELTKLRCEVVLCAPGSLANDGKVIEDARSYT